MFPGDCGIETTLKGRSKVSEGTVVLRKEKGF